jgi:hypothetical protein
MAETHPPTELPERRLIRVPPHQSPMLVVVIDTEEEFDWHAEFNRNATSVRTVEGVARAQEVLQSYHLRPIYMVDYPVAAQPEGYRPLKGFVDAGRATIGAHLHPWVSPPHEEAMCRRNSYPGNLPANLEARKLSALTAQIAAAFGTRPTVYKAGRYGLGPHTASILSEQEFEVDLSACPPFDFREDGGPDYRRWSSHAYWFGRDQRILGLPTTGAFVGFLRAVGPRLYGFVTGAKLRWAHVPGILSRAGAIDRLRLSPEGFSLAELKSLTRALLAAGVRTFSLSFHSPSLSPGYTPYVRSAAALERFYDVLRAYLDFFLGELGGIGRTPLEVRERLLALTAESAGTAGS